MSASEKLTALYDEYMPELDGRRVPGQGMEMAAEWFFQLIPQIRAVVEMAERDLIDGVSDGSLFIRPDASVQMLRDALAALDEVLS